MAKVDDLLVFSKAAELKNFSKTADQLNMVKSMVSKRITRLEKDLGVPLMHRSTRSMSLTDAGQILYEYTSRIEEELNNAMDAIDLTRKEPSGVLRVLSPISLGSYYLTGLIAEFMKSHPAIQVGLELSSYSTDLIESGLDVALHVGQPPDSNLLSRKVGCSRLTVCATPEYLKVYGTPLSIDDLSQHNCLIHRNLPRENTWVFKDHNKLREVTIAGNFTTNSSQSLKHAALAGIGLVMLPDYSLRDEIDQGRLVELLTEYGRQEVNIYALFPYTKHVSPKLRLFIDYLKEVMS